eukprot:5482891-Prorocentrum_lima.AAC.1
MYNKVKSSAQELGHNAKVVGTRARPQRLKGVQASCRAIYRGQQGPPAPRSRKTGHCAASEQSAGGPEVMVR